MIIRFGATSHTYALRGHAKRLEGEYTTALADLNKAISLDPNHAHAYYNRGQIFAKPGRTEAALSDYQNALQLAVKDKNKTFEAELLEVIKQLN